MRKNPINVVLLEKAPLLKKYFDFNSKPFFSKPYNDFDKQDEKDQEDYRETEKALKAANNKLKKGDKVIFNSPDRIKNKASFFGVDFQDHFFEGVIKTPVKRHKRTRMGEDCGYEAAKVVCGGYIYTVSPSDLQKAK